MSAVNRLPLSVSAACLMRSRALGTLPRRCVRSVFCEVAFPLACPLPSAPSSFGCLSSPVSLGAPWPCPAFPPSCPFRFAMAPSSGFFQSCSGTSSVLLDSQTPCSVHRWLESSDFPSRPAAPSATGGRRVSRFSRKVLPRMLGVSDRARPYCTSPFRCSRCCLRFQKRPRHLGTSLDFAAQSPACVCPCQRFGHGLSVVST